MEQVFDLVLTSAHAQEEGEAEAHAATTTTVVEAPQKGWFMDHVGLDNTFLSVPLVIGFLVLIFVVLKYFIYLPDPKRKDQE